MKPRVVLSMEQALSMTYATLRMVHLGWRVIRLEATPAGDAAHPGDPNRYIGNRVAEADRHAYYVAPNVGKEAIALNLKSAAGRAALHRIIRELDVDIFCCNTIPSRYAALGIDYATLATLKPDLVWAGISAMGPHYPEVPGYDPMIQAMAGYMELTGFADGPPTLSGIPLVDLKAGDEVYANVLLALLERQETGRGRRIDVSMLQAAASWLITTLPLLDMGCGPEEVTRWGNAHRKFIPSNVYPTADGHLYMAVGSNAQWRRLTASAMFHEVGHGGARDTAAVRYRERAAIYREISTLTARHPAAAVAAVLDAAQIPNARINTVAQVLELEAIRARVTTTTLPDGTPVRMQPQAVDIEGLVTDYPLAPRYGAHTCAILAEAGYAADEVARLVADGDAATTTPGAR